MNDAISSASSNFLAGAAFCLFGILVLNPLKVNKRGNLLLGIFCMLIFLSSLQDLSLLRGNELLADIITIFSYLHLGPMFYLAVISYLKPPNNTLFRCYVLHSIVPFLLTIVISLLFIANGLSPQLKILVGCTLLCFIITYSIYAIVSIKRYQKKLLLFYSETENIDLNWLLCIAIQVLLMGIIFLLDMIVFFDSLTFYTVSNIMILFGLIYLGCFACKQVEIHPVKAILAVQEAVLVAYDDANNGDDSHDLSDLRQDLEKLSELMKIHKPFLNKDLTLLMLSELSGFKLHYLSKLINLGFQKNFNQFINEYRVEEAKLLMLNKNLQHLNLYGIAFEAGFNSKTTFNTTFKKVTGQAPSKYKLGIDDQKQKPH